MTKKSHCTDILFEARHQANEAARMLDATLHAYRYLRKGDAIEILTKKLAEQEGKELPRQRGEYLAEFAQEQFDEGFPLLSAQMIISVWAQLEATVYDASKAWLVSTRFKTLSEDMLSTKFSFGELQNSNFKDRAELLIQAWEFKGPKTNVLGRFERIFSGIGWADQEGSYQALLFDGDKSKKDVLYSEVNDLINIRNLLLHNNGIINQKFKKVSPRFKEKIGEKIKLTPEDFRHCYDVIEFFIIYLACRIWDAEVSLGMRADKSDDPDFMEYIKEPLIGMAESNVLLSRSLGNID